MGIWLLLVSDQPAVKSWLHFLMASMGFWEITQQPYLENIEMKAIFQERQFPVPTNTALSGGRLRSYYTLLTYSLNIEIGPLSPHFTE